MVTIDKTQKSIHACGRFPTVRTRFEDYSNRNVLQCKALFFADPNGDGFTVVARNLPGVVSEGDTLAEAIENITEAFAESVLSYIEQGENIPWGEASDVLADTIPVRELYLSVKIDG